MHAIVRPTRIDIEGANGVAKNSWEPLLNELKAVRMPGLTLPGKRMVVVISPGGRVDAIIYRTGLPDKDVLSILAKYGIEANLADERAKGASA